MTPIGPIGAPKRRCLADTLGYTREQAYCLRSVTVDLKVSQVIDIPNLIVSAFLPLDVFA